MKAGSKSGQVKRKDMGGLSGRGMLKDFNFGVTLHVNSSTSTRIYILKMTARDNRFNPNFVEALNSALTFLLQDLTKFPEQTYALVLTGSGRFFSNGLDLNYLLTTTNPNEFLIKYFAPLLFRFLTLGIPTVALINGHAFAGGMAVALALDYRLALAPDNKTEILLSMNELLINAAIPAGILAIIRDCIYARRWTISQAFDDKIIDVLLTSSDSTDDSLILIEAIEFAKTKAIGFKHISVLQAIKEETYRDVCALLLDPKSDKLDPFRFAIPRNKI